MNSLCARCGKPGAYKPMTIKNVQGYSQPALYCYSCWYQAMKFPPNHPLKND